MWLHLWGLFGCVLLQQVNHMIWGTNPSSWTLTEGSSYSLPSKQWMNVVPGLFPASVAQSVSSWRGAESLQEWERRPMMPTEELWEKCAHVFPRSESVADLQHRASAQTAGFCRSDRFWKQTAVSLLCNCVCFHSDASFLSSDGDLTRFLTAQQLNWDIHNLYIWIFRWTPSWWETFPQLITVRTKHS